MKKIAITLAILLAGCSAKEQSDTATQPAVNQSDSQSSTQAMPDTTQVSAQQSGVSSQEYAPPAPQSVVSVYVEPPLVQPSPIRVDWAPPPMLVDTPPPQPSDDEIWTGGYWVWEGNWVWAHGSWAPPPRPGYHWNNPYYDHRDNSVIFVNGFWAAPGISFVAPSLNANIAIGVITLGVIAGSRPNGPEGVFIPAPPGSYYGLIVPAPIGTSPAVVSGLPPIIRSGMHITNNNQTNTTNITNVTVIAPANSTANGQAVNTSIPAQPHLAAAQTPVVNAAAPEPVSTKAIPTYVAGHPPMTLPSAQVVRPIVPSALIHPHTNVAPAAEITSARQVSTVSAHSQPVVPNSKHTKPNNQIEHPSPIAPPTTRPTTSESEHNNQNHVRPNETPPTQVRSPVVETKPSPVKRAEPPPTNEVSPIPPQPVEPSKAEPQKVDENLHKKLAPKNSKEEGKPADKKEHD
ncbi:hypothetical protein [Solimicrobium silvestre]|uniref:YXWGXW repeat (2 copies) n=1 Tax=Solimicrobium silvestre TaxID=2099400 RepID=A0A2S9GW53_9BURK|nr:hypothetical protein [Solimicrobium silvestre]PRC91940.1 hypothetical protein S2091_3282 [Solimicrobium silvestre]